MERLVWHCQHWKRMGMAVSCNWGGDKGSGDLSDRDKGREN
jgi:hypothetical protein